MNIIALVVWIYVFIGMAYSCYMCVKAGEYVDTMAEQVAGPFKLVEMGIKVFAALIMLMLWPLCLILAGVCLLDIKVIHRHDMV